MECHSSWREVAFHTKKDERLHPWIIASGGDWECRNVSNISVNEHVLEFIVAM